MKKIYKYSSLKRKQNKRGEHYEPHLESGVFGIHVSEDNVLTIAPVKGVSVPLVTFFEIVQQDKGLGKLLVDANNSFERKNPYKILRHEGISGCVDYDIEWIDGYIADYGLNLQFCSYVIYYSNDWDYGTRIQSEDRVHRMGQTENVHYIDICAADTLDERILKCLERKENLVDTFKYELENQKDVNILEKYIYYKNRKGRKKVGGVEKESAKAIEELKEGDEIG